MKTDVKIREVAESDTEKAFSLHNETFHVSRSPKDWLWEYKANHPECSVFLIAEAEGRIIGTQGMIPIPLNIRGKKGLTGKSENAFVDRSYRGRDLFQKMYDRAVTMCGERGMCCVWGLTRNKLVSKVLRDKFHFAVYEDVIQTYALTLRGGALPEVIQTKVRTRFATALVWSSYIYSLLCRYTFSGALNSSNIREGKDVVIENDARTENDLKQLYDRLRLKHDRLIHVEQDSSYLTWRLVNNPSLQYTTYFLYERGMLKAYCYLNIKDEIAHITDFTCEDRINGAILLKRVIHDLRKQRARFVLFMGNPSNPLTSLTLALIKRIGFLRLSILQFSFVLKNISCEVNISDLQDWYINGLWTEGYEW
jgi:GNAT superfamily N-acetyltransferase